MNVIQALGRYFPDSIGGTEVYVNQLVRELRQLGIHNIIAAPYEGVSPDSYTYDGTDIFRYPSYPNWSLQQVRGIHPHGGFETFTRWLLQQDAEIYHQHSWTSGCGLFHLEAARNAGKKTVVTIHVPGVVCLRGTMMHQAITACDGKIDLAKCGACWSMAKGLSSRTSSLISHIPIAVSRIAEQQMASSRLVTALAVSALVENHRSSLARLVSLSDRIVAVCQWLYEALLANGVPEEKLVLCRQGTFDVDSVKSENSKPLLEKVGEHKTLKVGFLGRWDKVKGIHVLVEAMRKLPHTINVELLIYASAQDKAGVAYRDTVSRISASDPRIHLLKPLLREDVPSTLASFDLLAIPSQWLETGPLVALEAQALRIPIIGSNLGGIAELVRHGEDGWLLPHSDVDAWSDALALFASDRSLVNKLRQQIRTPRSMATVASEMTALYKRVLE